MKAASLLPAIYAVDFLRDMASDCEEEAEVRRREIENTEKAIRQIFGNDGFNLDAPPPSISV